MQDVERVLFGAPQRRVLKAGAQGHRGAGMEQHKDDNHHSETESVVKPPCFMRKAEALCLFCVSEDKSHVL
jgi:hypothetical protein